MYLDQLTTSENNTLLKWQHISPRLQYLPKGKQPLWFSFLEETIITSSYTREIIDSISLNSPNPFPLSTGHFNTKKLWILSITNNQITLGKARKFFPANNTISITHWITDYNSSYTAYYPNFSTNCILCLGCNLNSNYIRNLCTIDVSATHSTKVWARPLTNNPSNKLKLNANLTDLIYNLAIRYLFTIPPLPSINLKNNYITEIFGFNETSKFLQNIAIQNLNQQELIFYTDGLVQNICTDQCSMGIGWVQIYNNQAIQTFAAQIKTWPSSYKAELIAILSAISTTPKNCKIKIFTDSQSVISKFNKIQQQTTNFNTKTKYNY